MKTPFLIALLTMLPLSVGAEEKYPLEYVDGIAGDESTELMSCVLGNKKIFCIKKQPKDDKPTLCTSDNPANPSSLNEKSCDDICGVKQPDKSQEWREKCDNAMKYITDDCGYKNTRCELATAYCTRALLEEIKSDK